MKNLQTAVFIMATFLTPLAFASTDLNCQQSGCGDGCTVSTSSSGITKCIWSSIELGDSKKTHTYYAYCRDNTKYIPATHIDCSSNGKVSIQGMTVGQDDGNDQYQQFQLKSSDGKQHSYVQLTCNGKPNNILQYEDSGSTLASGTSP